MQRFVCYLRVSTDHQGADGYGIDGQRAAVRAVAGDARQIAEFVEVESGKRDDRAKLRAALEHARAAQATLVVAKLDRLGRRASSVLGLLDRAGVPIVFADSPNASDLELGVRAVVAQEEARAIAERTKAGLAAARARGVRLGNLLGELGMEAAEAHRGRTLGRQAQADAAQAFAEGLKPILDMLRAEGVTTAKGLARELNEQGIPSRRGGAWDHKAVRKVLGRLDGENGEAVADQGGEPLDRAA